MATSALLRLPRQADTLDFRALIPGRSHVVVRPAQGEGAAPRDSSGRLTLPDDFDIPDVIFFSEWRGR
jgi:hypothetical protein